MASYVIPDKIIESVVERLVRVYRPERIYLFGSCARGEQTSHSDIDLMIVVPDAMSPDLRHAKHAYKALRGTGIAADIHVWTQTSFTERLHLKASLPSTVMREGRLLYAA
jgi:predicted nucleotidyltransferase